MRAAETKRRAEQAAGGDAARALVRVGWAAKAIVYLGLAWLVYQLATGTASGSEDASPTGALELIEQSTGSSLVLVVLGVGLLLYAGGRILEVTTLATSDMNARDKAEAGVMSLFYVVLAVSAFVVAATTGGGADGDQEQQGTAVLLDLPFGRFIVGVLGLGGLALGAVAAFKGVQRAFLPTLRIGQMSAALRTWAERFGVIAYVTKGAIFALVGWFLLQAAITYDSEKAAGLDEALRRVAEEGWGRAVLLAMSAGLVAYGLFCALEVRYRKIGISAGGTV